MRGLAAFDLDEHSASRSFIYEIDLPLSTVPIVPDSVRHATIGIVLPELGHDESLEDGPAQRMARQLVCRGYAKKIADKPRVEKVHLRSLGETLGHVREPWRQTAHNVARLQDGNPLQCGLARYAAVRCEVRGVQQLPCPSGAESKKLREAGDRSSK